MDLPALTSWAQFGFLVAGSVVVVVGAVALLFKTMGSTYGGIIAALQNQNVYQQGQIDNLKKETNDCLRKHDECERRYEALETSDAAKTQELTALKRSVEAVEKKVNGGH